MIIGERIKERLAALGMSQAQLARHVKLDQSTINGLIKGEQRSTTKLHQIARALGTTTAFLSGETSNSSADEASTPQFDGETLDIIEHMKVLCAADRRAVAQVVRSLAGRGPPNDLRERSQLPSEPALAQMFEGLLEGISPATSLIERAQLLARRLPIGLSQLHDVQPDADRSSPAEADRKVRASPAKRHRVPQS